MVKHRLTIKHKWALGDTVLLTALVRDIHKAYPGKYEIVVDTHWTPVWWHNPWVVKASTPAAGPSQHVTVSWGDAIRWNSVAKYPDRRRELKHILAWYHYDFEKTTGIRVPVTEPRGELFLTAEERKPIIRGRYWVVVGGGKLDITNKHWNTDCYQEVINRLSDKGLFFVQCGATHRNNVHPPLENCINMVGKTDNVRDLFNLIMHADGVLCPVTGAMHIAAVFQKPCVVIAGGREEPWFEWYGDGFEAFGKGCKPVAMPHKFLHTTGLLWCCDKQGCWKRRTVPIEPSDMQGKGAKDLCKEPVRLLNGQAVAGCMNLITPNHVCEAIMDHYDEKILPPIKQDATDGRPVGEEKAVIAKQPEGITLTRVATVESQPPLVPPLTAPAVVRPPSLPALRQKPMQQRPPKEYLRTAVSGSNFSIFDNPIIGGRFTVCVLCYGPHTELAKKCLNSILTTLPRDRMDLRIATNEAAPATVDFVRSVGADRVYINTQNRKKYPVMREMFHDPSFPLRTNYLVWFDDDAVAVESQWAVRLAETIIGNHKHGCRLYGAKMYHDLNIYAKNGHRPDRWFQMAPWHRGVNFRLRNSDRAAPNGSCIDFVAGWFWAVGVDAIRTANIPDQRLNHNGGDITIGAQVIQAGYKIREFNKGKSLVWCPPKDQGGRRGYEEAFPWSRPMK